MRGITSGRPQSMRIGHVLLLACVCVFGVLSACGGDDNKKSRNPVPVLASVSPNSAMVGGAGFTLTATGTGFVSGSVLQWNGVAGTTTYVSSTQLTAAIPASNLASAGTAQLTVMSPPRGGGTSSPVVFTIQNPAPVASYLNPQGTTAGAAAFDLTVTGTDFVSGSVVQWNGSARATTFVSGTVLKAAVAAADVATAGTAQVRVVSPGPGGGTSSALSFIINALAPVPALVELSPAGVAAGSPAFDLLVTGLGFTTDTKVQWNGTDRPTTFVSSMHLKAAIAAADVASAGSFTVTVKTPPPGGGTSNGLNFIVTRPVVARDLLPITVAPDGSPPNGPSINGGIDYVGRYAIFASKASNLIAGDTNEAWDIFVRDTCIDEWGDPVAGCQPSTSRISVAPDGGQANGDSGSTATSPDRALSVSFSGRYVAFVSSASNLVAGDTNGVDDVFVRDTCIGARTACTPATIRASIRSDGSQTALPSSAPAVSEEPNYVVFVSADPGLVAGDANGVADVFLSQVCTTVGCAPAIRRVSVGPGDVEANAASNSPTFTGRYVAYTSAASNLVAGDTNGLVDVFLRDTCLGATGCTPLTERVSVGTGGNQADGSSSEPLMSLPMSGANGYDYHGRFVLFVSNASNLVAGDTNGVADVFMRDTCRGRPNCIPSTERVSLTSTGQQITGHSSLQPGHMRWDGEVVLFVTAANGVVPDDTNGLADVFMRGVCHDTTTCVTTTGRVSVGANALQGNGASFAPRGNYDPWVGPEYITFMSEATNFLAVPPPSPYYGSIFRTTRTY